MSLRPFLLCVGVLALAPASCRDSFPADPAEAPREQCANGDCGADGLEESPDASTVGGSSDSGLDAAISYEGSDGSLQADAGVDAAFGDGGQLETRDGSGLDVHVDDAGERPRPDASLWDGGVGDGGRDAGAEDGGRDGGGSADASIVLGPCEDISAPQLDGGSCVSYWERNEIDTNMDETPRSPWQNGFYDQINQMTTLSAGIYAYPQPNPVKWATVVEFHRPGVTGWISYKLAVPFVMTNAVKGLRRLQKTNRIDGCKDRPSMITSNFMHVLREEPSGDLLLASAIQVATTAKGEVLIDRSFSFEFSAKWVDVGCPDHNALYRPVAIDFSVPSSPLPVRVMPGERKKFSYLGKTYCATVKTALRRLDGACGVAGFALYRSDLIDVK